jgi:hypothetical protein
MRLESTSRAAPFLAGAGVLAVGAAAWPYTVDDAYITARYATRIATGAGYTMNDGPPTDGVTGPLWLLPGVIARGLGGDPVLAAKLVGLACAALAAALLVAQVGRRAVGSRAVWTACAFLVSSATLGIWAVAGLETGAATLALTLALLAAVRRPEPSGALLGVAGAALVWLRPEAVPGAIVLGVMAARRNRREGLVGLSMIGASLAAVVAFRLAMFGQALPLSLSAKPAELGQGAGYVGRGLVLALGGIAIAPAAIAVRGSRSLRVPAALVVTHVLAVWVAGGDWMPGYRLLAPILPAFAWLLGAGVSDLGRRPRVGGRGALAIAALCCALGVLDLPIELAAARDAAHTRDTVGAELAADLRAHAHRVAMIDIGYLAYASGVEVVDLVGVTDPSIGLLPGRHGEKDVDLPILMQREVDTVVLHSVVEPRVEDGRLRSLAGFRVERALAGDAAFADVFEVRRVVRYTDHYWYVVLTRRAPA